MTTEHEHPDLLTLEALALGRLGTRKMKDLEAHLAACPSCLQAALAVPGDDLVRALRRDEATPTPVEPTSDRSLTESENQSMTSTQSEQTPTRLPKGKVQ